MKDCRITWLGIFVVLTCLISCQKASSNRKIRLSNTTQTITRNEDHLSTTIHLEPSKQRSIAVMFFKNQTGDNNLEWLQQGLSEMFIRALSQSRHLSVLGQDRLIEILERLDNSTDDVDMNMAAIVAKEANVEVVLRGNINRQGEALQLNVQLVEPYEGLILREESIEGDGLETILSMVDRLSQKIQGYLPVSEDKMDSFRGIAELSTNSMEAWHQYTHAEELCAQLLTQDAIPFYQKAIELDSTFVSPYLKLRQCYEGQGDKEMAYALYQMAEKLKDHATKQEQYQLELTRAGLNGDIERLLNLQEKWVHENPSDVQAYHELATYYFALRNYDKAIDYYHKSHQIDPKHKLTLNQLGYSYALTGDYQKAVDILNSYRETVPDEPNPYDSLGEIYLFQGDYKKAAKLFKMAVDRNSEFAPSWNHLANAAADAGDYKKAIAYFEQSMDFQADGAMKSKTLSDIAGLYQRMGNTEKALSSYRQAMEEYDLQFGSVLNMAKIYKAMGDTALADKLLKDQYDKIKSSLTTDRKKREHSLQLAAISLWHGIETERSLQTVDSALAIMDNPIEMFRAQFFKTLLLIKLERYDEISTVWQEEYEARFLSVMQNVKSFGYSEIWKYFHILNDLFEYVPDQGMTIYQNFIESSMRLNINFYEAGFRGLLADLYDRTGHPDLACEQLQTVGIPADSLWMVLGPFENRDGFNRRFPPEKKIDLARTYSQGKRRMQWEPMDDGYSDGYLDLREQYDEADWSVAYGLITIISPYEKKVQFRTGSDEAVKIWLNDEEVWRLNRVQSAIIDDHMTPVTLKPGRNQVLIKICNRYSDWGFYFRVTDENGKGVQDIRFMAPDGSQGDIS